MPIPDSTAVLVVGAGPTGLMLANQLARHNVPVCIIDRHAGAALQTRALGVQARTLEIYAKLGIANQAIALGRRAEGGNLWVEGKRATLELADGSRRDICANWVAGCDGAHSAVRRLNGIDFPGAPYEQVFFVADTIAQGPMVAGELNIFLRRDGFNLFFPMRGVDHWRVVGILPRGLRDREDLRFDDVSNSVSSGVGADLSFRDCAWFSTYRIHHRRAARFREGSCFLLGDAAHVHSPVGAQGMNTGLQDAYNLGWKLALVASGHGHEPLLDSYASEREPVAEHLLDTTDRAFSLVVSESRSARVLRGSLVAKIAAFAMRFDAARRFAFRTVSQIGIRYPRSPLSVASHDLPDTAPRAGDRFPWIRFLRATDAPREDLFELLDDRRFNLLRIGASKAPALSPALDHWINKIEIPDEAANRPALARVRVPSPSAYLLRPDGHIGLAGRNLDEKSIGDYLAERVGVKLQAKGIKLGSESH